jgi:hypothetical protein
MELETVDDLSKGSDRSCQVSSEELQAGPKAIACTTFRVHGPAPVDETLIRLQGITRSVQARQDDFRRAKVAPGLDPHRHRIQVTGR